MEDREIIELYFRRDEQAISETAAKYGAFCRRISQNILSVDADAEECVNDAYLHVWNTIPPQKPDNLGAWLGRVVRNCCYDRYRKNRRQKRYAGMVELLDELEECIPSPDTVERRLEEEELTAAVNLWLTSLAKNDRILFVRRYWQGDALKLLAEETGISSAAMAKKMYRLRQALKAALEKEGYFL